MVLATVPIRIRATGKAVERGFEAPARKNAGVVGLVLVFGARMHISIWIAGSVAK